jgi:2,4-dienoyl-CoA reductase-like NADH-dependent reductase (Old Yellow Enzyme family)
MAGMESSADAFLSEIEAFLARERAAPSTFGRAAVGDPNFVRQLREGRAPSLRLVDRARAYMAARRRAAGGLVEPPEI